MDNREYFLQQKNKSKPLTKKRLQDKIRRRKEANLPFDYLTEDLIGCFDFYYIVEDLELKTSNIIQIFSRDLKILKKNKYKFIRYQGCVPVFHKK